MHTFIIIVPEDWIQLDWPYISNNVPNMSPSNVMNAGPREVEEWLKAANLIPVESYLLDFNLVDDTYFLIKLG